jgi:hypothetical protein
VEVGHPTFPQGRERIPTQNPLSRSWTTQSSSPSIRWITNWFPVTCFEISCAHLTKNSLGHLISYTHWSLKDNCQLSILVIWASLGICLPSHIMPKLL